MTKEQTIKSNLATGNAGRFDFGHIIRNMLFKSPKIVWWASMAVLAVLMFADGNHHEN